MIEFQMYRFKVFPSAQMQLFEKPLSPQEILKQTVAATPEVTLRKNVVWHIGNIEKMGEHGLYFAFGKTTDSTLSIYEDGKFRELEYSSAPYTHVILDTALEVCAIAKKPKLSPTTGGIANRLVELLNRSDKAKSFEAVFEINQLQDPQSFIDYLRKAYRVSKFTVKFTRPNHFDVETDFSKPFERYINEVGGDKGKAEITGRELNPEKLEQVTRSAASSGDAISAQIENKKGEKTTKHLKNNPVIIKSPNELSTTAEREQLLNTLQASYKRVRDASPEKYE